MFCSPGLLETTGTERDVVQYRQNLLHKEEDGNDSEASEAAKIIRGLQISLRSMIHGQSRIDIAPMREAAIWAPRYSIFKQEPFSNSHVSIRSGITQKGDALL